MFLNREISEANPGHAYSPRRENMAPKRRGGDLLELATHLFRIAYGS
jgi:hypothetical protein